LNEEALALELLGHRRWRWLEGMSVRWNEHRLTIVQIRPEGTFFAFFRGSGIGIEVDPEEHKPLPDLGGSGMAMVFLDLLTDATPYAQFSIVRRGSISSRHTPEMFTGRWTVIGDTGSQMIVHSHDDLVVALGQALLDAWDRLDRMMLSRREDD